MSDVVLNSRFALLLMMVATCKRNADDSYFLLLLVILDHKRTLFKQTAPVICPQIGLLNYLFVLYSFFFFFVRYNSKFLLDFVY